jgi:hypothetical protein
LQFLIDRPFSSTKRTRMWFTPEQIETKALKKLVWLNNNVIEKEMVQLFYEIFESVTDDTIRITPREVVSNLNKARRKIFEVNEIRKVLKNKWSLKPSDNSNSYKGFDYTSYGEFIQTDRKGRFFEIEREKILKIFDEMMTE